MAGEEDELREAEIERFDVLGGMPGDDLQALVQLAAQICDVPTAAVSLVTGSHQHQVATVGVEPSVRSREDSMCAVVVSERSVVVVPDARADDRFRAHPFVTGEIGSARFYASAPLVTHRGVPIGRLCVFDDQPRRLDAHQQKALAMLADRVVDLLELRRRGRELEQSLAELIRTQEELRRSNLRLSHFAGQVSHDLRTPLTAMLLNTEAALGEPSVAGDPVVQELLLAVRDSGRRLSLLIDEVLAFARLGASLRMGNVDLAAVMRAVYRDLAPLLDERAATVHVGELPTVLGDAQGLYSVLLNLVSNAVKFAVPGARPQVVVRARRRDDGWRVEVVDDGPGLTEEERARVFLPFERGATTEPGTGIGLSTAKLVVEAHGGRIGLAAGEGAGTVAWFELAD